VLGVFVFILGAIKHYQSFFDKCNGSNGSLNIENDSIVVAAVGGHILRKRENEEGNAKASPKKMFDSQKKSGA
jgi:hypothetical protein